MQNKILPKIGISVFLFIAIMNFSQTKAQDSVVVKTTADAFVYTGTGGNSSNYGTQKNICVRYGAGAAINSTTTNRWGFLKFPTKTINGSISKAYLRLRYFYRDGGTNSYVLANGIKLSTTDTSWIETGTNSINGNNLPSFDDSLTVSEGVPGYTYPTGASANNISSTFLNTSSPSSDDSINTYTYYWYVDITDYLNTAIQSGTVPELSFAIQGFSDNTNPNYKSTAISNNTINFFSKEFRNASSKTVDSLAPSLVIYYTPSTTPITSSPITAVNTGKNISLSWTTYTEINSSKFYIQRSSDATSFVTIDSVNAAHTSTSPIKYSYTDKVPLSGTNYYRFKEVDLDGTSTYSLNVASINFYGGNKNIKIYPNPATEGESIVIDLNAVGNYNVKLIDESGKAVQSNDYASTQKISLPTKALTKGVYFVVIYSKGEKIATSSVIIK